MLAFPPEQSVAAITVLQMCDITTLKSPVFSGISGNPDQDRIMRRE